MNMYTYIYNGCNVYIYIYIYSSICICICIYIYMYFCIYIYVTASLMQNMVQIRKENTYFVTKLFLGNFGRSSFGALVVESPHGGAICMDHMYNISIYSYIIYYNRYIILNIYIHVTYII